MVELPEPISHTVVAIWEAYEKDAWSGDNLGVPVSMVANECERALWYAFRWATQSERMDGQRLRRFATGDREEDRLLDDLERAGLTVERLDPATGQQFRVQLADGWLRGKLDAKALGVLEAPKTMHVVECKSHNDKSFKDLKKKRLKEGKRDHYAQCQCYMHAESITRCLYIAVNKNTDEIYAERVNYDKAYAQSAEAKVTRIVEANIAPPKLHEDPHAKGAFVCSWCRHADVCHAGEMPRKNCRTCISSSFESGAVVNCTFFNKELSYEDQQKGCPHHLFLPSLIPGEQIDASEEDRWVKYRLRDGTEWTNTGG